jgi:hypothetical protein
MRVVVYSALLTIGQTIEGRVFDFQPIGAGSGTIRDGELAGMAYTIHGDSQSHPIEVPDDFQRTTAFDAVQRVWNGDEGFTMGE